ncbi:MAG: hypothetical protein INH41_00410 [Myxococcaceae bacterium]|jgi:hypothetical protein|nr:hypothetical protein [Myxococcaceae bacterium]MCA3010838.1 hypothetical protein [Myxococcaceae bacterium]
MLATLLTLSLLGAEPAHGPSAPLNQLLSHRFRLEARQPGLQLAFHAGLLQPLFVQGFNAAMDVRVGRFVATYSHGEGLDGIGQTALLDAERAAGASLGLTWSTGGGIGLTLIDELYVLMDVKVHRYAFAVGAERDEYTTLTVGAELGYRFFLWKGLHVTPVVRYWPNVWSSAPSGVVAGGLTHQPVAQGLQGFFANVLIGWAFDLVPEGGSWTQGG